MASDQCPGAKVMIYGVTTDGTQKRLFSGVNEQTGPGGSPDGVQATVKSNELPFMPVNKRILTGGQKILLKAQLTTADGVDASDCVVNFPIIRNGQQEFLTATELGFDTDLPAGSLANIEHQLGSGYTIPQGDEVQIGGGNYFISIENDTA